MTKLRVHLSFIERVGKEELEISNFNDISLLDHLALLGIKHDEIGMIIADGRWRHPEDVLISEHLVIEVFPHLEGG